MQNLIQRRTAAQTPAYLPIQLESLRIDQILDFDLYINAGREMILYRSKALPFVEDSRAKLLRNSITTIYISAAAKADYQRYMARNLPEIVKDQTIQRSKKASIIYDYSKALVKDVLSNPTYPENIRLSQDLVENTISYILQGRQAFLSLMKITSYDYYTFTHSVNVCTFSLSLARQLRITDRDTLTELGTGALLHDIGKSKVSERILNKRTPLNRAEFEVMKKHPGWGVEILRETNLIPEVSYLPVLQHHERIDGSGYPNAIGEKELHLFSRIVAVCDVFDALTTRRVYQAALDTYPALRIMHGMKGAIDPDILREFTVMLGPDSAENDY